MAAATPLAQPYAVSPSSSSSQSTAPSRSVKPVRWREPSKRSNSLRILRCEDASPGSSSSTSRESWPEDEGGSSLPPDYTGNTLRIGSPIIITEAPLALKTADSMPSLKMNTGLINPGDVGRIVARKPKDVWAVRLAIGTYLLDAKHFRPLDLQE